MYPSRTCKSSFPIFSVAALLLFTFSSAFSQSADYKLSSSDNEFSMQLFRESDGVDISLLFTKASQFEYISIEKSADAQNGFSQCKYIKFNESANDSVLIIKRDVYPLAASEDVYYRVKTVTKEGVTRAYPPVRLPALRDEKKRQE